MDKQSAIPQQIATGPLTDKLDVPLLYLSSEEVGWEGLVAQAFHEPAELDGWMAAPLPDTSLLLFKGGAMYMEQRPINGRWNSLYMRQGDLALSPGGGPAYEVRWKGLTATPTQTLHLSLSNDLLARTAQEVADHDPARLDLVVRLC